MKLLSRVLTMLVLSISVTAVQPVMAQEGPSSSLGVSYSHFMTTSQLGLEADLHLFRNLSLSGTAHFGDVFGLQRSENQFYSARLGWKFTSIWSATSALEFGGAFASRDFRDEAFFPLVASAEVPLIDRSDWRLSASVGAGPAWRWQEGGAQSGWEYFTEAGALLRYRQLGLSFSASGVSGDYLYGGRSSLGLRWSW